MANNTITTELEDRPMSCGDTSGNATMNDMDTLKTLTKRLDSTHQLTIRVDYGLYDWLREKALASNQRRKKPQEFEVLVAHALASEMRDRSFQWLNARAEQIRTTAVWLREDLAHLFRLLLLNLTNRSAEEVDSWIKQEIPPPKEKRSHRIEVGELWGGPPTPTKLNAYATPTDTEVREITISVDGTVMEPLTKEAEAIGISVEELAAHILYNYRDNDEIRSIERNLMISDAMIARVVDDGLDLVEKTLIETHPEAADDIRARLSKFRPAKKKK